MWTGLGEAGHFFIQASGDAPKYTSGVKEIAAEEVEQFLASRHSIYVPEASVSVPA